MLLMIFDHLVTLPPQKNKLHDDILDQCYSAQQNIEPPPPTKKIFFIIIIFFLGASREDFPSTRHQLQNGALICDIHYAL